MKKINVDETFKQELITKFTEYVNNTKFTDNRITFTTSIDTSVDTKNIARPVVYISPTAYLKMLLYVRDTDVEIAWHGTVERNQEQNWYHIKDVFLYPQIIRAATVDTDQEKYQEWLQNIEDDEVFNNIRFQGHSHVNMGTFPSGTDLNMYNNFLQVLPKNDYYIFMIMNKSGSVTCFIYDLAKNLIYETADIDIRILGPKTHNLIKDINTEKEKYCEKPVYSWNTTKTYSDIEQYYAERDLPCSTKSNKTEDVNDLIDSINSKYKNSRITTIKRKNNTKVKGGK